MVANPFLPLIKTEHKRLSHPSWLSYLGGLDLKIDTVFEDVEFRARDRLAAVVAAQRKEKGSR